MLDGFGSRVPDVSFGLEPESYIGHDSSGRDRSQTAGILKMGGCLQLSRSFRAAAGSHKGFDSEQHQVEVVSTATDGVEVKSV